MIPQYLTFFSTSEVFPRQRRYFDAYTTSLLSGVTVSVKTCGSNNSNLLPFRQRGGNGKTIEISPCSKRGSAATLALRIVIFFPSVDQRHNWSSRMIRYCFVIENVLIKYAFDNFGNQESISAGSFPQPLPSRVAGKRTVIYGTVRNRRSPIVIANKPCASYAQI